MLIIGLTLMYSVLEVFCRITMVSNSRFEERIGHGLALLIWLFIGTVFLIGIL
jgi:hypothetical protein